MIRHKMRMIILYFLLHDDFLFHEDDHSFLHNNFLLHDDAHWFHDNHPCFHNAMSDHLWRSLRWTWCSFSLKRINPKDARVYRNVARATIKVDHATIKSTKFVNVLLRSWNLDATSAIIKSDKVYQHIDSLLELAESRLTRRELPWNIADFILNIGDFILDDEDFILDDGD